MSDHYPHDLHYTGAPNECAIHWPTEMVEGVCPDCRHEGLQDGLFLADLLDEDANNR